MQCKTSYQRIRSVLIIILISFNIWAFAQDSWIEGGSRRGTLPGDYDQDGRIHIAEIILAIDLYLHSSSESEYLDFNANGNAPESQELQLVLDAFLELDLDSDQIADAWETVNGLNTTLDDGAENPDGDSLINLKEYDYKTDPLTSNSAVVGIAARFQELLNIPSTSEVIVAGPVEPGTIIREKFATYENTPVIQIPITPGTYYAFLIDDAPLKRFYHPMRYAWMEVNTEAYDVVNAGYRGIILRPGIDPSPFELIESFIIDSVSYSVMQGEGQPELMDDSHKEAFDPFSEDMVFGNRAGDEETFLKSMIPRKLNKFALVIDCGDELGKKSQAEGNYTYNSKPMARWLKNDYGFSVNHISQYWGKEAPEPSFKPPLGGSSLKDILYATIAAYGRIFNTAQEPDNGCDEFFLYIVGHGKSDNFLMYNSNGISYELIDWTLILTIIHGTFPPWVKVTIFYDACYAGNLITLNQALIDLLCNKLCSLTILTAVNSTQESWASLWWWFKDSATEDFLQGADKDYDGDGNKGDIYDRYWHMWMEGWSQGFRPLKMHCGKTESWCCTDGPKITSQCEDEKLSYLMGFNEEYLMEPLFCNHVETQVATGPVVHPDPEVPSHPRADDHTTTYAMGGLPVTLNESQVSKLQADFPCPEDPDPDDDKGGCPWGLGKASGIASGNQLMVFFNVLHSDIHQEDPVNSYQYGFAFDRDTIPENNYQPDAEHANDFFKDADFWIIANYTPSSGWSIERKTGDLKPTASNSKIIITENTIILIVRRDEFFANFIGLRCTTFRHPGDGGVGGDWDGDVQPPVADGLYWMYIGSD